ncbi:MAG: hypothetical protein Q7U75_01970, partial [Desulfobacterales bacterium]|nr:hypothetical protein [Desulfobacterales bacterium]
MKRSGFDGTTRETVFGLTLIWALTLAAALWFNPFWVSVAITALLWVYLCSAWNIVGGILGQVSFGHAAFFGVGAYTSTFLAARYGLSPWFGMLAGGATAAAIA